MSNTSTVNLEVVLTVQRLIHKFGAEQDSLTWDLILDIAAALTRSIQVLFLLRLSARKSVCVTKFWTNAFIFNYSE